MCSCSMGCGSVERLGVFRVGALQHVSEAGRRSIFEEPEKVMDARVAASASFDKGGKGTTGSDEYRETDGDHQGSERNWKRNDRNASEDEDDRADLVEEVDQCFSIGIDCLPVRRSVGSRLVVWWNVLIREANVIFAHGAEDVEGPGRSPDSYRSMGDSRRDEISFPRFDHPRVVADAELHAALEQDTALLVRMMVAIDDRALIHLEQ